MKIKYNIYNINNKLLLLLLYFNINNNNIYCENNRSKSQKKEIKSKSSLKNNVNDGNLSEMDTDDSDNEGNSTTVSDNESNSTEVSDGDNLFKRDIDSNSDNLSEKDTDDSDGEGKDIQLKDHQDNEDNKNFDNTVDNNLKKEEEKPVKKISKPMTMLQKSIKGVFFIGIFGFIVYVYNRRNSKKEETTGENGAIIEQEEELEDEGGSEEGEGTEKGRLEKKLQNLEKALKELKDGGFLNNNGKIELKLMTDLNFKSVNNELLNQVIKILYDEMYLCENEEDYEEMIKNNMEHQFEYGNDIYKLKEIKNQNKYKDFYFTYNIDSGGITITILTKKDDLNNEYNQLLNIGYIFIDTIYFIEYFCKDNKSIQLIYNNNHLSRINFKQNNTTTFILDKNLDENNEENTWQLNLNRDTIIQENITLTNEQIQQIKITDSFLKEINNIRTITPVINTSLPVLKVEGIKQLEEKIEQLQQRIEKAEEEKELENLKDALTAIYESGFVSNGEIQLKLMTDLNFQNIQEQQLEELEELKPLIQYLYHQISSCHNKEEYKQMIKRNMKHNYQYGKDIFKLINQGNKDKYENFYFQYFILESEIQINILTKKQNTTNEYNQLLNIGYNFYYKNYYIEYFIEENKSIVLIYNNNHLSRINFNKNNNRIFCLENQNNKENTWDLKDKNDKLIQENITLTNEQINPIKTTYEFLKTINNMPTITHFHVKDESLQVLNINVKQGIEKLEERIKKEEIDTTEFVNKDHQIQLKLMTDLNFKNVQATQLQQLQPLIKDLYDKMSSCHNKEEYKQMIKRNMEHNYQYGNGIYKFKEDKYDNFYFTYDIDDDNDYIQINILTRQKDTEYNQLLKIGYDFYNEQYYIEYFIDNNKNNSIVLFYNNNYLNTINFNKNDITIFCLENPNNKENKWELKDNDNNPIQENITLTEDQKEQIKKIYEFLKIINNMATITPIPLINESLEVLNFNAQAGIAKLTEKKIDTTGFVKDNKIQLKLITDLNFKNIQDTELKEELQQLIQYLYDQMCSFDFRKAYEEMIERNMEHQFKYGNGIYKFKEDKYQNKYKDFYFTYDIDDDNDYIQINILTKKQDTTNEYHQLLNIGYDFYNEQYYIEYFIDEDNNNSIVLWYNDNGLYMIDFKQNDTIIFYLDKSLDENNKEDKWKLNLNQTIKDNITLIEEQIQQIKITDSFLKSLLPKKQQEE